MKLWGLVVGAALLVLGVVAGPLAAEDLLIRRDGNRSSGKLQACIGEICNWSGTTVPRSEIAWIGLGATGSPPTPRQPRLDAIWPKDAPEISSPIVGISLGEVATEAESIDRTDVSWVYFGSADGLPRLPPAARVDAAPAPPARTGKRPAPTMDSSAEKVPAAAVSVVPHQEQSSFIELGKFDPVPAIDDFESSSRAGSRSRSRLNTAVLAEPEASRKAALQRVSSESPNVRIAALYVLSITLKAEDAESLAALLQSKDSKERVLAAAGMLALGDRRAVPVLIEALGMEEALPFGAPPIRVWERARAALLSFSGQDFGLRRAATADEAEATAPAWRSWWSEAEAAFEVVRTPRQFGR